MSAAPHAASPGGEVGGEQAVHAAERVDLSTVRSLNEAARVFLSHRTPRLLAKNAATLWGARVFMGPPSVLELPIVAGVAAWWPFQEWLLHKYFLHLEPKERFGRHFDPDFARRHRAHHRDPSDLDMTLLPYGLVRAAMPVSYAISVVMGLGSPRRSVTAAASWATMALIYEWTHFLVHTGYKPRSKLFRRIRRNHRHHHYHNERYWHSFTWPDVDRWLGTEPNPKTVPHSDTARKLHGLDD